MANPTCAGVLLQNPKDSNRVHFKGVPEKDKIPLAIQRRNEFDRMMPIVLQSSVALEKASKKDKNAEGHGQAQQMLESRFRDMQGKWTTLTAWLHMKISSDLPRRLGEEIYPGLKMGAKRLKNGAIELSVPFPSGGKSKTVLGEVSVCRNDADELYILLQRQGEDGIPYDDAFKLEKYGDYKSAVEKLKLLAVKAAVDFAHGQLTKASISSAYNNDIGFAIIVPQHKKLSRSSPSVHREKQFVLEFPEGAGKIFGASYPFEPVFPVVNTAGNFGEVMGALLSGIEIFKPKTD